MKLNQKKVKMRKIHAYYIKQDGSIILVKDSKRENLKVVVFDLQKKEYIHKILTSIKIDNSLSNWVFEIDNFVFLVQSNGIFHKMPAFAKDHLTLNHEKVKISENQNFKNFYFEPKTRRFVVFEKNLRLILIYSFNSLLEISFVRQISLQLEGEFKWKAKNTFIGLGFDKKIQVIDISNGEYIAEISIKNYKFDISQQTGRIYAYNIDSNSLFVNSNTKVKAKNEFDTIPLFLTKNSLQKIAKLTIFHEESSNLIFFGTFDVNSQRFHIFRHDFQLKMVELFYIFDQNMFPKKVHFIFSQKVLFGYLFSSKNQLFEMFSLPSLFRSTENYLIKSNCFWTPESILKPLILEKHSEDIATFTFDTNTSFICQKGVFNVDFEKESANLIYQFSKNNIQHFFNFDFKYDTINPNFIVYCWTSLSNLIPQTSILILNIDAIFYLNLENSRQIEIFSLNADLKTISLIHLSAENTSMLYTTLKEEKTSNSWTKIETITKFSNKIIFFKLYPQKNLIFLLENMITHQCLSKASISKNQEECFVS